MQKPKWHITKHAQQRRPHFDKIPEIELIKFLDAIDKALDFNSLEIGKYKLRYHNFGAIIARDKIGFVLITIRNFHRILPEQYSKIKIAPAEAAFMDGNGHRVTRINFKDKEVKCGVVIPRPDGFKLLKLNSDLHKKYMIPHLNRTGIIFKEDSEVSKWVYFDGTEYKMNTFERIQSGENISAKDMTNKKHWTYFKQLQIEKTRAYDVKIS